MASDIQATKSPLFVPMDEQQAMNYQPLSEDQLNDLSLQFPISLVLIESLQKFATGQGSIAKVNALLDTIVKNEEFLFQDIPIMYEATGGFLSFVPDDNQTYQINWKSIIFQYHLSFLYAEGSEEFSNIKRLFKYEKAPQPTVQARFQTQASFTGASMAGPAVGSLARRQQMAAVGSFSDKRFGTMTTVGSLARSQVPQLVREDSASNNLNEEELPPDMDLHQCATLQLQCGMQNQFFRALVATLFSRGLYDLTFGYLLLNEYKDVFDNAGISTAKAQDVLTLYETFYKNVEIGQKLDDAFVKKCIIEDNVNPVLDLIASMDTRLCTHHVRKFIESSIAPLCYHENSVIAQKAAELYTLYISCVNWEPKEIRVTTVKSAINFPRQGDCVVLIAIPSNNRKQYISIQPGNFIPITTGFYDACYAHITQSGEYSIDKALPTIRYIVLPSTARKEIIHDLPAFNEQGPVNFQELENTLDILAQTGVTAVHVAGAISTLSQWRLTHVTDHTVINKACGGIDKFTNFCAHAKKLNMRVLLDFEPLVSIMMSSRKYAPYQTLYVDEAGRLVTVVIPKSDLQLLLQHMDDLKILQLLFHGVRPRDDLADIRAPPLMLQGNFQNSFRRCKF